MTDLNQMCVRIRCTDDQGAVKGLFENYKIKSIIESAIRRAKQKNPEYDLQLLRYTIQFEIWDEIKHKYIAAADPDKGDNLVLRFIKSIAYNRLMNFIRDDKSLKWTDAGYVHKMPRRALSSDTPSLKSELDNHISTNYSIELVDLDASSDSYILKEEKIVAVRKALNKMVINGMTSPMDNFILLLKYQEDKSYTEIRDVLKEQFGMDCSVSYVGQRLTHATSVLRTVLECYKFDGESG